VDVPREAGEQAIDRLLHAEGPRLMIPGPCEVEPHVLRALGRQVPAHYGEAWTACFEEVLGRLQDLLGAARTYLLPGSGSSAVETMLVNLFCPGDRVLVPDTGYFGRRIAAMARAHGMRVRTLPVAPGRPVPVADVSAAIGDAHGVALVHVETSTGVRHPVAEIAGIAAAAGRLCAVDAVASAGGELLDVSAMQLDAVATSPQKGIGAVPGVGIIGLGHRAHQQVTAGAGHIPAWYQSLAVWDRARIDCDGWEPHPVTMPTNVVLALAAALRHTQGQGLEDRVEQRRQLARYCRDRLARLGFAPRQAARDAANLVVVVRHERAAQVRQALLARSSIAVAGGLAPFADGDTLRVGLLGRNATREAVDTLLDAVASTLR
jgi:alanine-glyoxylate transaminase / serine-glyoxylate transaminase / serine-pyruvate transaminase